MANGTLKVGTITTSTGSGTITIPSGVTLSGGGIDNTPAFSASIGSNQTLSDATDTKANFDTERFDTNNTFSSSRFTPAVAGKYFCYSGCRVGNDGANTLTLSHISFYKNGSAYLINTTPTIIFNASSSAINNYGAMVTQTIDLDSNDYVEVYIQCDTSTGSPDLLNGSFFGAYKLIGV